MKILNIGSNSVHVATFLENVQQFDLFLFSEEDCGFLSHNKEYVFKIRTINIFNILSNLISIKQTLRKLNPDVIHVHQLNRFAFIVCLLSNKRTPIISTAWGSDVLIMPWKNKLFFKITKFILNKSKIVTADSMDMIEKMKRIDNTPSKYVHLQYGIEFVNTEEKQNIIYSNRLHKPLYRISQIIDYFADFVKENPTWKLVIAGIGEDTEHLKERVDMFNISHAVEFVGWLNKVDNQKYFAKSKAYVSIPMSDGTSVSLLEAMSAGCIPIVSNLEVTKEWIKHKENGIIEEVNKNPFFEIDTLDISNVHKLNLYILEQNNVSREKAINKFKELYRSLIVK